jgi:hypothetical protein
MRSPLSSFAAFARTRSLAHRGARRASSSAPTVRKRTADPEAALGLTYRR